MKISAGFTCLALSTASSPSAQYSGRCPIPVTTFPKSSVRRHVVNDQYCLHFLPPSKKLACTKLLQLATQ